MTLERRKPLEPGSKPLAPGKPLARKTPMPTGRPPSRSDKLERTRRTPGDADKAPAKKPAPKKAPRRTGPTAETVALIRARDRGLCVRDGRPATNSHHRENRGMGGRKGTESERINGPEYLLSLCGSGTTGCHGWVTEHPREAAADGYVLPKNSALIEAASTPVLTVDGWALFHADGTRTPCPNPNKEIP